MKIFRTIGIILLAAMLIACVVLFFMRMEATRASDRAALDAALATPKPTAAPEGTPVPAGSDATPEPTAEPTPTPEPEATPEPTPAPDSPAGRAAALGLPAPPDIDIDSWEFILGNGWNSIGEYTPEIEMLENQGFDPRVIEPMKAFVQATRDQGLSVFLSSGYRSYADQKYLFDRKVSQVGSYEAAARIVLPPGTSEHQTGLTCDITDRYYETKDHTLENTAMYKYMSQHCQEYGFIVRYPADKEDITGVMYEPWHFRYVGVEVANYMVETNLCFEEFVSLYKEIYSADNPAPTA